MDKTNDTLRRINRVQNFVAANVRESHNVEQLAQVAHLSKFHFHRLYRALTGETVQEMVRRLRLESAAATLLYRIEQSVTQIAHDHGYSSSANFTKAFTRHFGSPPNIYRIERPRHAQNSKPGKAPPRNSRHPVQIEYEVNIRHQAPACLAYIRATGKFEHLQISDMHDEIEQWVSQHECQATETMSLGITWSDSHIVAEENWIYDACLAVQPETNAAGSVGIQTLPGGRTAQLEIRLAAGASHDLTDSWDWLVGNWLLTSDHVLRDAPSYEQYFPSNEGLIVRLCLPLI